MKHRIITNGTVYIIQAAVTEKRYVFWGPVDEYWRNVSLQRSDAYGTYREELIFLTKEEAEKKIKELAIDGANASEKWVVCD